VALTESRPRDRAGPDCIPCPSAAPNNAGSPPATYLQGETHTQLAPDQLPEALGIHAVYHASLISVCAMSTGASQEEAKTLLAQLTQDLESTRINHSTAQQRLEKLKALGRDPRNVANIYDEQGIKVLGGYAFGDLPPPISSEGLRCIANALLLLPTTRSHALRFSLDQKAADSLRHADQDQEFLLSRILFLLTYDPAIDMDSLVAHHDLAESLVKNLTRHATTQTTNGQGLMALMETLKLLFNATNVKTDHAERFSPAVEAIMQILTFTDVPSPPLQPPITLLLNALANLDIDGSLLKASETTAILDKLITILERSVRSLPSTELETAAIPLLTVLRKINEVGPSQLRASMKSQLLPQDEERDQPIGKSSSLASQLLRLTTSSGMVSLSEAISGLMFELSDKDANLYVQNVGYGYAAGYLMTHKIPIPESARKTRDNGETSGQIPVNPITGQRLDREPAVELPEMTREEKEREAERLFVLFERLKATGVVDVQNPVELARDAGRIEELSDSDE
jgi:hypothetical protein